MTSKSMMRKAGECVHKRNELRDVVKKKIASQWFNGKESSANAGDVGLISGLGRSPGGGNGNPLQYSCLENPIDRERSLADYSS